MIKGIRFLIENLRLYILKVHLSGNIPIIYTIY